MQAGRAPVIKTDRKGGTMASYTPLQQKAYEYLLNLIRTGGLEPGVIYSETKLAGEIGISRTPFKDALVRLSQDKYIDILPSKGFCLHVMSPEDIWTTYQARTAVEGYCAMDLAAAKDSEAGRAALDRLAESLRCMEQMIREKAPLPDILACDLAFHQTIAEFPRNAELIRLYESLNHRVSYIALESFAKQGRPARALEEHRSIYQAVSGAGAQVEIGPYLAVMRHMEASRDIVLELTEKKNP